MQKLLIGVILVFGLMAGCAHSPNHPIQYYGLAGKCWNWDSIQKDARKYGPCGKIVFFKNEVFTCSRGKDHGGWHHGHLNDAHCVILW